MRVQRQEADTSMERQWRQTCVAKIESCLIREIREFSLGFLVEGGGLVVRRLMFDPGQMVACSRKEINQLVALNA